MTDLEYQRMCQLGRPLADSEALQADDGGHGLQIDFSGDRLPPLFIFSERRLKPEAFQNLRDCIQRAFANVTTQQFLVLEPGLHFYQFDKKTQKWERMHNPEDS